MQEARCERTKRRGVREGIASVGGAHTIASRQAASPSAFESSNRTVEARASEPENMQTRESREMIEGGPHTGGTSPRHPPEDESLRAWEGARRSPAFIYHILTKQRDVAYKQGGTDRVADLRLVAIGNGNSKYRMSCPQEQSRTAVRKDSAQLSYIDEASGTKRTSDRVANIGRNERVLESQSR